MDFLGNFIKGMCVIVLWLVLIASVVGALYALFAMVVLAMQGDNVGDGLPLLFISGVAFLISGGILYALKK